MPKPTLPLHEPTRQVPVPGMFPRLVGAAEVLGAAGPILPGLLQRPPTPVGGRV